MFPLLENIVQLEDLDINDFIHKIETMSILNLKKSIKGLSFFFGLDEEGKLYTSKYSNKDKFYTSNRYENNPDNNGFIGAHKYVFKFKHSLENILEPNEVVECKIQFFNHIFEKTNKLVVIKSEHTTTLSELFKRKLVKFSNTFSIDGLNTSTIESPSYWEGGLPEKVEHVDTSGIKDQVKKLKDYLSSTSNIDDKYTNYDVMTINLGSIDKEKRPIFKTEREKITDYVMTEFKLPIKDKLISKNKNMEIENDEDTIEIKDNDIKSTDFFLKPKHELSGIVRTTDPDAKLDLKGGLYGVVQQRIATLFGMPEIANINSAKKVFGELKGDTMEATAENFAKSMPANRYYSIRTKLIAIYNALLRDIDEKLDNFKKDVGTYELKLSDEAVLKYSQDDIQNNLNAFGELFDAVHDQLHLIKLSKDYTDIVMAVFRRPLELVHQEVVKEGRYSQLEHLSTEKICHAFTANYICGMLLIRNKDKNAGSMLRDSSYNLKKFNPRGSRINFWGFLLFSNKADDLLSTYTFKQVSKLAGRIIDKRIGYALTSMSRSQNMTQDWDTQSETFNLLITRLETDEKGLRDCMKVIRNWDDASLSDKTTVINKLYFYLQRHDSSSPLFGRLRLLANNLLINTKSDSNKEGVLGVSKESLIKIAEDAAVAGGSGGAGATGASASGVTVAGSVASYPSRIFGGMAKRTKPGIFTPAPQRKKRKIKRVVDINKPVSNALPTAESIMQEVEMQTSSPDRGYEQGSYNPAAKVHPTKYVNRTAPDIIKPPKKNKKIKRGDATHEVTSNDIDAIRTVENLLQMAEELVGVPDGGVDGGAAGAKMQNQGGPGMVNNGVPKKMAGNRPIIRRKRDFVKKNKFERPKTLAPKDNDIDDGSNQSSTGPAPNSFTESFKTITQEYGSILLDWTDEDCFKPDYNGYEFVKKEYELKLTVTEAKTTWPSVKLSGHKLDLSRFLYEQYGMKISEIKKMIGE